MPNKVGLMIKLTSVYKPHVLFWQLCLINKKPFTGVQFGTLNIFSAFLLQSVLLQTVPHNFYHQFREINIYLLAG